MICFLRPRIGSDLLVLDDDTFFLHVINSDNTIDLGLYITCIYMLIEQYEKLVIHVSTDMPNNEKMKIVLSKNISPKISYMIA